MGVRTTRTITEFRGLLAMQLPRSRVIAAGVWRVPRHGRSKWRALSGPARRRCVDRPYGRPSGARARQAPECGAPRSRNATSSTPARDIRRPADARRRVAERQSPRTPRSSSPASASLAGAGTGARPLHRRRQEPPSLTEAGNAARHSKLPRSDQSHGGDLRESQERAPAPAPDESPDAARAASSSPLQRAPRRPTMSLSSRNVRTRREARTARCHGR